uniref:Uncharacterized protein n=1 Tax=Crocodylus porosus TaxID=8502 RepID=A0A7M4FZ50_CROPO
MCSLGTSRFQSSCRSTSRAKMDQARAAISNLFRGEALSYTRFSMARQTDRDNSQVEMKLSAEEEEGGENSVPENMQTPVAKPRRTYNSWYCIAMMVVVLFLSGCCSPGTPVGICSCNSNKAALRQAELP